MIRGMISGLIWGAVFSAGLGVTLTQFGGRIDVVRTAVPPAAVDAAGGTVPAVDTSAGATGTALGTTPTISDTPQPGSQPAAETAVDGSGDVARPATISVDGVASATSPEGEDASGPAEGQAPELARSPQAELPQTGADGLPTRVPDAPVAGGSEAVRAPDTPTAPAGQEDAPEAPQVASVGSGSVSDTPSAPGVESAGAGDAIIAGAAPPEAPGAMAAPGDPSALEDQTDGVAVNPVSDARPSTPRPAAPGRFVNNDLDDDVLAALEPADAPRRIVLPQTQERDAALESPRDRAAPDVGSNPEAEPSEQDLALDDEPEPQTEGAQSAARVVVNRLPRIGDPLPGEEAADAADVGQADEGEEESTEVAALEPSESTAVDVTDGNAESDPVVVEGSGALYANSVPFDRVDDEPVMAVVLIDDPNASTNFRALPISVTIAVASDSVGSVQRAQQHREAGREVVLIPPITGSDSRTDIARRLTEAMQNIPEAVAVMDMPGQAFQRSRFAVGEVMVALAGSGHGMIIYPGGLNTAERLGVQQNVATARVFREIDGLGQDAAAVKLLLDQAAFQARQLNTVILIGRNRPETVQALAEWVDRRLDNSVKLAPVSVALKP